MADNDHESDESAPPRSHGKQVDLSDAAIEQRLKKVRQLTVEEYAKKDIDITSEPMRKDIVRLTRLKDK
jgi:hypothetical protein